MLLSTSINLRKTGTVRPALRSVEAHSMRVNTHAVRTKAAVGHARHEHVQEGDARHGRTRAAAPSRGRARTRGRRRIRMCGWQRLHRQGAAAAAPWHARRGRGRSGRLAALLQVGHAAAGHQAREALRQGRHLRRRLLSRAAGGGHVVYCEDGTWSYFDDKNVQCITGSSNLGLLPRHIEER